MIEQLSKMQALEFRKSLGFSTIEPIDVVNVCRMKEVNLIFKPYGRDSFSGIAMKRDKELFVLANSSKTLGHQNFTIAHEFNHLFFKEDFKESICNISKIEGRKNAQEREADFFAINLLIPDDGIYHFLKDKKTLKKDSIPVKEIISLESIFRVSHMAMLIKLKRMGLISEGYLERKKNGIIELARAMEIDKSLYLPTDETKVISDYVLLARKAYEEEKISIDKFEGLLHRVGLSISDMSSEELISEDM
ncbi:ImmA/IrrE family metallo-endopeptidase [candidate division WOR-3 bacterium]|nr:ImmA/IrrE family metallo-endopeptidase [candidate division WOR-3 bacterium]